MTDYRKLSTEIFDQILQDTVADLSAADLLAIPGIYEILSEHFNNDVLETWEQTLEYRQQAILPSLGGTMPWTLDTAGVPTVYDDADDLIQDLKDNYFAVIELGTDPLPAGVHDIRGQVHDEPDRIFAYQEDEGDAWLYVGISLVSSQA